MEYLGQCLWIVRLKTAVEVPIASGRLFGHRVPDFFAKEYIYVVYGELVYNEYINKNNYLELIKERIERFWNSYISSVHTFYVMMKLSTNSKVNGVQCLLVICLQYDSVHKTHSKTFSIKKNNNMNLEQFSCYSNVSSYRNHDRDWRS